METMNEMITETVRDNCQGSEIIHLCILIVQETMRNIFFEMYFSHGWKILQSSFCDSHCLLMVFDHTLSLSSLVSGENDSILSERTRQLNVTIDDAFSDALIENIFSVVIQYPRCIPILKVTVVLFLKVSM